MAFSDKALDTMSRCGEYHCAGCNQECGTKPHPETIRILATELLAARQQLTAIIAEFGSVEECVRLARAKGDDSHSGAFIDHDGTDGE